MKALTLAGTGDAVTASITSAFLALFTFLPALIGALLILVIGWIISDVIARLVERVFDRMGFERAAERSGVSGFIARSGAGNVRATHVLAEMVKWFIRLIFLEAAANAVHLTAVTTTIHSIILFLPNVVVALLVLMIGAMLAQFVSRMVRASAAQTGAGNPDLLARLARYAIIGFAVIVAVHQVGIATTLVDSFFMALVFGVALAFGLAFGLGGRETAQQIVQQWYSKGREMGNRAQAQATPAPTGFRQQRQPVGFAGNAEPPVVEARRTVATDMPDPTASTPFTEERRRQP
jgi:hypothetical protein